MKVDPDALRRIADERRARNEAAAAVSQATPASQPEDGGDKRAKLVLIGVGVVVLILVAAIAMLM